MKKVLFLMLAVFGGAVLLKGNVSVTRDNQVHVASWSFPIPAIIRNSQAMGLITLIAGGLGTPAQAGPAAPPPLPVITTTNGTYDGNRPSTGRSPTGADQFNTTSKALRGSQ